MSSITPPISPINVYFITLLGRDLLSGWTPMGASYEWILDSLDNNFPIAFKQRKFIMGRL